MTKIKETLIQSWLEENDAADKQTAEQERAIREWKEALSIADIPISQTRCEIDEAAFGLAASYQCDGMHSGFELACHMFGEILGEMLRGGATA